MIDFPTILYRTPGPHRKPRGGTYKTIGAADQAAFADLTSKGWFPSYEAAVADTIKAVEKPIDEVSAPDAPGTGIQGQRTWGIV